MPEEERNSRNRCVGHGLHRLLHTSKDVLASADRSRHGCHGTMGECLEAWRDANGIPMTTTSSSLHKPSIGCFTSTRIFAELMRCFLASLPASFEFSFGVVGCASLATVGNICIASAHQSRAEITKPRTPHL